MDKKQLQKKVEDIRNLIDPQRVKTQRKMEKRRGLAKGLAVGTLLGGLAGIFLAPDKGENTRKKTKEELEKAKEVLENNFQESKVKLSSFMEDKKDIFGDKMFILKDKVRSSAEFIDEDEDEEEGVEKVEA